MKLFIAVDCQNDFIEGALGSAEAQAAAGRIAARLAEDKSRLVLFTKDEHGEDYMSTQEGRLLPVPHCLKDTHGWEINADIFCAWQSNAQAIRLEFLNDNNTLIKHTFGAEQLAPTVGILNELYGIDCIELAGFCTDICVVSNALLLKAYFAETPICLDASLCAGSSIERHASALDVLRSCQITVI